MSAVYCSLHADLGPLNFQDLRYVAKLESPLLTSYHRLVLLPFPSFLQRGVVCVFLPRNTDLRALAEAVPPGWVWEVQRCYVNAKLKGVSLYATPTPEGKLSSVFGVCGMQVM